jgi:glycosyltransferase involved in cell wall biosynthesis
MICSNFIINSGHWEGNNCMQVTVLTPTYNRAHTLKRLLKSLEKQTYKDFCWLVVDDGSLDNTKDLISTFRENSTVPIRYIYKENGGKHTAINKGVCNITTELTFIVDSDDYLTDNAIKTICTLWEKYKENKSIGGIWFLNSSINGKIIGDKFPEDEYVGNYVKDIINNKLKGDKATVYLNSALKQFMSPVYEGEKRVATGVVHKRISEMYNIILSNKPIYICDYQEDGLTNAGVAWRIKNPLGGMANSKAFFTKDVLFSIRLKKLILYITYSFFSKQKYKNTLTESGYPLLSFICTPFSLFLYQYWQKKYLK